MAVDKNMKIMIVDDYSTMLRIIRNLLRQLDFNNVDEANNGSDALQKLKESPFNLIISDWNMEPMTGLDLLKSVRADAKLKATSKNSLFPARSKSDSRMLTQRGVLHHGPAGIFRFAAAI